MPARLLFWTSLLNDGGLIIVGMALAGRPELGSDIHGYRDDVAESKVPALARFHPFAPHHGPAGKTHYGGFRETLERMKSCTHRARATNSWRMRRRGLNESPNLSMNKNKLSAETGAAARLPFPVLLGRLFQQRSRLLPLIISLVALPEF